MHQKIDLQGALDRRSIFLGGAIVVVAFTLASAAAITSTSALGKVEKPLFDKTWMLPDIERIAVQ